MPASLPESWVVGSNRGGTGVIFSCDSFLVMHELEDANDDE